MEFSDSYGADLPMIKCRTSDGLELDLEASLQYRVAKDKLFEIYTTYGDEEKEILKRVVIDIISDSSTKYSSNQFFQQRSEIQAQMEKDLKEKVLDATFHEVIFFQLRSLSLPDAFEREIQTTEVRGQDINTASSETVRERVKFVTKVEVAQLAVQATLEEAYGIANKTIYEAKAIEDTVKTVVAKQSASFAVMK